MTAFDKLADLAMLYISEDEKEKAERDMRNIVAFADRISSFQTEECDEDFTFAVSSEELREDLPKEGIARELILSNSHKAENGYISVPKSFKG